MKGAEQLKSRVFQLNEGSILGAILKLRAAFRSTAIIYKEPKDSWLCLGPRTGLVRKNQNKNTKTTAEFSRLSQCTQHCI